MSQYSVTITSGAGTLTFQSQPFYEPEFRYEYNTDRDPPTLRAIEERWTLRRAATGSAVEATVTDAWDDAVDVLAGTVTNVSFKRDSTVVHQLDSTTHKIMVESMRADDVGGGTWKNHLFQTIVVSGRRELDTDDIVSLSQKLSFEYGPAGLLTKTLTGRVKTVSGTSAQTEAEGLGLESPGDAFGLQTNGTGGVSVVVENYPDDTEASFTSVYREFGTTLPASVEDWSFIENAERTPHGTRITRRVSGVGSGIEAAVAAQRPTGALLGDSQEYDSTALSGTGTFVTHEANSLAVTLYGLTAKTVRLSRSVLTSGGRRTKEPFLVPGFDPILSESAKHPVTVSEDIEVEAVGITDASEIALPPPLFPDPVENEVQHPTVIEWGLTASAHKWRAGARRRYIFASVANVGSPSIPAGALIGDLGVEA